jgi:hypothetical protein
MRSTRFASNRIAKLTERKPAKKAAAKATSEIAPEKDRQFVTALARGLDVLRCFTRATPALGTADIARLTGLAQPTVWRLCYTLIQEGYLVQTDRGGRLRPGISVLGLGQGAIASMPIAELARADMQALASRYQCAVSLGMRDGHYMVYMQRMQGSQIICPRLQQAGRTLPDSRKTNARRSSRNFRKLTRSAGRPCCRRSSNRSRSTSARATSSTRGLCMHRSMRWQCRSCHRTAACCYL